MRYAIAKWIAPLVVVEVDPREFDGPGADDLMKKLNAHFRGAHFALITPDLEPDSGIRAKGLACPHEVLTDPALVWHELTMPDEPDVPF